MKISVVIPVYNEGPSVLLLYKKIKAALEYLDYEIVFVDDGSTDNTFSELRKIEDDRARIINYVENKGQCFALYTGLKHSQADTIATIDADLQNDPADIPLMLAELEKGYDFVCGWRYERKDNLVKRLFSKTANFLQNLLLGLNLHDSSCPLKVFKKACVSKIKYFKHYHRFISALVFLQGYRIKEYRCLHYPRQWGVSKYGIRGRFWGTIKTFFKIKFGYKKLFE